MSARKAVVERYIDGFRTGDHELVLSCLTDDVTWEMPGYFEPLQGKEAFDAAIEHDAFEGRPRITIDRMIEEGEEVVLVGAVQAAVKDGGRLEAVFCDVFTFTGERIRRLETYQVTLKGPGAVNFAA